jgi:hypothetical protein
MKPGTYCTQRLLLNCLFHYKRCKLGCKVGSMMKLGTIDEDQVRIG